MQTTFTKPEIEIPSHTPTSNGRTGQTPSFPANRVDRNTASRLLETLTDSKIYQDYERAFSSATGLPLTLRSVEVWQPAHRGKKHENRFCLLMAQHSRSCAAWAFIMASAATA